MDLLVSATPLRARGQPHAAAGDTVTARATILEKFDDKNFVKIQTQCLVGDKVVLDGEATIMVPSRNN